PLHGLQAIQGFVYGEDRHRAAQRQPAAESIDSTAQEAIAPPEPSFNVFNVNMQNNLSHASHLSHAEGSVVVSSRAWSNAADPTTVSLVAAPAQPYRSQTCRTS